MPSLLWETLLRFFERLLCTSTDSRPSIQMDHEFDPAT